MAESLADAVNPLTGLGRGRIMAFRLYVVVDGGDQRLLPMTLCATIDEMRAFQDAMDQMLDHGEEVRRTAAPVGEFYRDAERRS